MLDVWVSGYSRAVQFVFVVVYTTVDPLLGDDSNILQMITIYWLVNIQESMEKHHFLWVNI